METVSELEPLTAEEPSSAFSLSNPARAVLAVLSIGAAAIHLVMVPSRAGESLLEGMTFAASG